MHDQTAQPVIKQALGKSWNNLSEIIRQHYDMSPGKADHMVIHGVMHEVYHSKTARLFLLPGRVFGALVPYQGKNIPTEVRNWATDENHKAMFWHRTLSFPDKPPVVFSSRMEYQQDNEIIEFVRYGMGLRMRLAEQHGALIFRSTGYIWKIGPLRIPIPNWLILGEAQIIESAVSDKQFYLDFSIRHPLFGKTFSYAGTFYIEDAK